MKDSACFGHRMVNRTTEWTGFGRPCRPHSHQGLWRRLAAMLFLVLALTHPARADNNECPRDVLIGFSASLCAAAGPYTITLNGAQAIATSTGRDCAAIVPTNKAYARLTIDKTYQVTAGAGICSTTINFDVPEGYTLYINGIETTVAQQGTFTDGPGAGDGTWNVVVRQKCPCGQDNAGESDGPGLGSVIWEVGLGKLDDGRSAAHISLREAELTATSYTPSALIYSPPPLTSDVDVVLDATSGSLRQVKAPQTLADVNVLSGSEYDIRFYRPADVGPKVGGLYTILGPPFVTWKIKNPDPPPALTHLQISKIQNGITDTSTVTRDVVANSWTLTRGGGASVQTKTSVGTPPSDRVETTIITDGTGQVASKVRRTYHPFDWGEALTQEVADPDGAALTTTYTYYAPPTYTPSTDPARYSKVQSITRPDGSWETYDYDARGNKALALRPWKDLPASASLATETNSLAIHYTYATSDGVSTANVISRMEEDLPGTTAPIPVRITTFSRSSTTTVNGLTAVIEGEDVSLPLLGTGQTTVTMRYYSSAPRLLANRIASIQYPDGRYDTYAYENGNYTTNLDPSLNQFTPDPSGKAERTTVVHGTLSSPNGVAFKTTKETTVRDSYGNTVLQETYVYNGTTYERVAWTVRYYDDRGHLTQTTRHTGQVATITWNGDQKTSEIDESGVETDYTVYDALGRVQTQVKKGVAANPPYPAQPDITTTYTYDAEGRTLTETVTSGTLSLSRSSQYDKAGRLILETDNAGLATGYAYTNGGRTETITRPGGATQITDKYLDGQTKSITGTAVVARYFDYGVDEADGARYTQEFIGPSGLASPRWTKTTTDGLGRAIFVEKSSYLSATLVRTYTYNRKGQLQVEGVLENWTSKLQADTRHEYDDLGNQIRVGLDVNADGALTALSPDRYVETNVVYQKSGTDWFRATTTTTYLIDNNATATTLRTEQERLTNFPLSGTEQTVSDVTVTDAAGNQTRTTSGIDRAAKKRIDRTYAPDSTTTAVRITVNGLLQSTAPTTPETATTYAYDALGRLTGVTDPRTGTTTNTYSPTTGQLISTSDAVQTTSYDYYPATDPNAGRLKSQTNGNNKKVYFNYSSRGELIQTWGDTTYPLEYVYDGYGQRTELHTFRGGSGWQLATWPTGATGTVDVTLWGYDVSSGLVTSKQDASGIAFYTEYDTLGRLIRRTWARNAFSVVTNYAYDLYTGQQTTVTYTDATPAVAFVYDRGGRPVLVTDAAGTHTLTPNAAGQVQTEAIASGILDGVTITHGYDALLRPNALQTALNGATLTSQSYTYDPTGRLGTVTNSGQTATYAYDPSAGFLNATTFTSGMLLSRSYDPVGRLQSISAAIVSTPPLVSYTYQYNNLSQRTRATREDSSYWSYGYNDRGEVTSGLKYWSDNTLVAGQQFTYTFDNIGNRSATQAGGDALGGNLRTSIYTPNNLNQYTQRTVPNAVDILGRAQSAATVTVNTQATYRRADYFQKAATLDNSDNPVYGQINVVGVRSNVGPNGENAITQQSGSVYLPYTPEAYTYDYDGNLIADGSWNYTWDAENRLIRMESIAGVPNEAKRMLEFAYDYLGRRIQKRVYAWDSSTNAILLQSTTRFIYEGWNLIAELDGSGTLIRSYVWSLINGDGELLLINEAGNSYIAGYDGNRNITSLVKASTGTIAASYDYSPAGETLQATGDYAARNPVRFSTKYTDQETGLVYYGYRYYNPSVGRWLSRDPLGEAGGENLYGFVRNDSANRTDYLGLIDVALIPGIMDHHGWRNGSTLMRKWFLGPSNSDPKRGTPDTTTIKMNSWVLTFARAKKVYDQIFSEKVYINGPAQRRIVEVLKGKGLMNSPNREKFGNFSLPVPKIDEDYINQRPVGGSLQEMRQPDDMVAALFRFNLRVAIKGEVCPVDRTSKRRITIEEVGIYVRDSYDFNDDSKYISQPLGFWNATTNYAGPDPSLGDPVTNYTFRRWRDAHGSGGDYLVFSDIKVTSLALERDGKESFEANP